MKNLKRVFSIMLVAVTLITACKKDEPSSPNNQNNPGTPNNPNPPQPGTFNVKMTDGPGDFEAMNVNIISVEAWHDSKGWIMLDQQNRTVNILSLRNGTEMTLASKTNVDAGVYTKLRIKYGNTNKLTLNANLLGSNNTVDLQWDGAQETEVVINQQVSSSVGASVLLDFDVASSVREQAGQYIIRPVITEIKDARTGAQGRVQGSANAVVYFTDGQNTYSTYINAQGDFMIRGMKNGTYKMIVKPAKTAIGQVQPKEKEIEGVVIVQGQIKQMGTITLE